MMEPKLLHASSEELEKEHVHDVYKHIAVHFSETRYKPWPRVAQFLQQQLNGSLIADVGCGNGKYLGVCPHAFVLGSDMCPPLVSIAGGRGHEVLVCDCLNLPYRSNAFDAVLCIAVIHHLSTRERRVDALRELVRVTQPGGKVLVYVWAMEQERKKFTQQDVMVPWHLQTINFQKKPNSQKPRKRKGPHTKPLDIMEERPLEKASSDLQGEPTDTSEPDRNEDSRQFNPKDSVKGHVRGGEDDPIISGSFVDPTTPPPLKEAAASQQVRSDSCGQQGKGSQIFQRYYHVFCKGELKRLFSEGVPAANVKEEYYDHENWCVVAEKLHTSTV